MSKNQTEEPIIGKLEIFGVKDGQKYVWNVDHITESYKEEIMTEIAWRTSKWIRVKTSDGGDTLIRTETITGASYKRYGT